ncbi:MAG: hypothetical protein AABY15_02850 [Nanoarchaeota archaeon]
MNDKETIEEYVARLMSEMRFDVDVEFCKKHDITFSPNSGDMTEEEFEKIDLFNSKANKEAFDFVSKKF